MSEILTRVVWNKMGRRADYAGAKHLSFFPAEKNLEKLNNIYTCAIFKAAYVFAVK